MPFDEHGNYHPGHLPDAAKDAVLTYIDWVRLGRPRRSAADIRQIFHDHCEPCDLYDPNMWTPHRPGGCLECRCHMSDDVKYLGNAISLANKGCPHPKGAKWLPLVDKPKE